MLMILRIIWRLVKKGIFVLLVGWTPKPPPDFEERLRQVELVSERTRQRVYREGKAEEAQAEPVVTIPQPDVVPYWPGPRHSDGTPVQHGDSFH